MPAPIYTAENCKMAYQLNWSLAVFWNARPPEPEEWLPTLRAAAERDGVRVLEHLADGKTSQFLLSTQPATRPPDIARSIKGRLQYLIRDKMPQAFRRNYGLYSVGSANRDAVEEYVCSQLTHHVMADDRVQERVARLQIERPVDLGQPRTSGHAQFIYNLHVVLVNQQHLCDVREDVLVARHDRVIAAAEKKGHLLSRAGILTITCI
jgi:hypothetical protein